MNKKMLVDPDGKFPSEELSRVEENALLLFKILDVEAYERTRKVFKLYVDKKVLLVTGNNLYILTRDIDIKEMKSNLAVRARAINFDELNKLDDNKKAKKVMELLNNL